MNSTQVKVGIVGLGRWARVLARASLHSETLKITTGYSRSEQKRSAFRDEFGIAVAPDLGAMLADPEIGGVIITAPNEQHLPIAREVAKAGKHIYTEKPIASTLEDGLEIEALEKNLWGDRHRGPQRPLDGRHPSASARPSTPASSAASDSSRPTSRTSARSSSPRRPGAGTRTRRRAGRSRNWRFTTSTSCTISAGTLSQPARCPRSSRRPAPRSTINP